MARQALDAVSASSGIAADLAGRGDCDHVIVVDSDEELAGYEAGDIVL
jgi:hypothetical protein